MGFEIYTGDLNFADSCAWRIDPAGFCCFEWQDTSRLADELAVEAIVERVHQLEDHRKQFEQRFGTTDSHSVSVFESDAHDAIHERMGAISEWQSLEHDIRLDELAPQLSQNDGHLLST